MKKLLLLGLLALLSACVNVHVHFPQADKPADAPVPPAKAAPAQ
jgi:hypothetical protein